MVGFCFDIEGDGLTKEVTKLWSVVLKDLDNPSEKNLTVNPFKDDKAKDKIIDFIKSYRDGCNVVGHNILGFDMFALKFVLGMDFEVGKPDSFCGKKVQFIDTLYLSQYLNPDRGRHSIEYFGSILGLPKIDWRAKAIELGLIDCDSKDGAEFLQYHPEMDVYCNRDVDVNIRVFNYLKEEYKDVYKHWDDVTTNSFRCGQKQFFLMNCQELTGWKFDIEGATNLRNKIDEMMENIRKEVEPKLPRRGLKATEQASFRMPKKPFKKDGSYSATWDNFVKKHNGEKIKDGLNWNEETGNWSVLPTYKFYGRIYDVFPETLLAVDLPMEMSDQNQMKEWFLQMGWKPTLWNYKKDKNNKPVRDNKGNLIPTSPKIQENGKLCPNLELLEGDLCKNVVKWLSLRNRRSVLEGWLTNPRLNIDGRIGAGKTGITSTHRQKHSIVVNVPKAEDSVTLGKEMRALWICEDGMEIAACDAKALEGRVQGHYTYPFDNGETAREILQGDPHSKNAAAFYKHLKEVNQFDISAPDFDKDNIVFKPYRSKSKNGYYCVLYGGKEAKLAKTLGLPVSMGKELFKIFWENNQGTKLLKDSLEEYYKDQTRGRKKFLKAVDGRMLRVRKISALLNTVFQSCGAIAMDYASCYMDSWLGKLYYDEYRRPYYLYNGYVVRRIGYFHDELEFESDKRISNTIDKMIEMAIVKAGEALKLNVPLAGEGKIGLNWKEVH